MNFYSLGNKTFETDFDTDELRYENLNSSVTALALTSSYCPEPRLLPEFSNFLQAIGRSEKKRVK